MDNTVNDLRLEIKFQNRVKDKSNFLLSETLLFFFFFLKKHILFLETYFLKIPKNLIASAFLFFFFFLPSQILKDIEMSRQKSRMLHW